MLEIREALPKMMEEVKEVLQSFKKVLGRLPYPVWRTLGQLMLPADDGEELHGEIFSGNVVIWGGSDAFVKDSAAAFAWVL